MTMTNDQFSRKLDLLGSDLTRWPAQERAAAETLAGSSAIARALLDEARRIDAILTRTMGPAGNGSASIGRVVNALSQPLPRQKGRFFTSLPNIFLNWDLSPAWPRVAALAGCAMLGFMIGISGVDQMISSGSFATANADDISAIYDISDLSGVGL